MAKDTAQDPGEVDWDALKQLKDAGLTNEQIGALSQSTTSHPGATELSAFEAARAEYRALLDAYQSDPSNQTLGGTSNEEYRALALAQKAKSDAESAYYKALRGTTDDPFRYNPRFNDETAYFTDPEGNFGLGIRPEDTYYNDYSGTMVEGQAQNPTNTGSTLPGGGGGLAGPADARPQIEGGQDPFAPPPNYQQSGGNGLPNNGIPEGYLPDSNGNSYWDYVTNGGLVDNVPGYNGNYVQNGPQQSYNSLVNENLGQGGGAVTGVSGSGLTDWFDAIRPELTGWEASTNKDYYQKQFQDLGTQKNAQGLAELAAAVRAQEASSAPQGEPFGGDPWSWANLPEVQMGGTQTTTPVEWGLNSNYGITEGMTNQQAAGSLGQLLTPQEQAIMSEHFRNNPDTASGTRWTTAGSPIPLLTQVGTNNPLSPEFANVLQKVFNNIYTQTGGGTTGFAVPEGYAAPINVQGAA